MANPVLGAVFKSPMIEQIFVWQVLQQITAALLAPVVAEIEQTAFGQFPSLASPPAELVAGVIRGYLDPSRAREEAKKSGYDQEPFDLMVNIAGQPPPPGTLLELWRRKVIPERGTGAGAVSVEQGIKEGDTKNKWIEPLKALKTALPSPEMALQALLQGQTEKPNAQDLYEQWGGDPRYFDLMFETRGSAPTPLEAASMAHRGIIPWAGRGPDVVSFEQAFLEGPWRNKWLDPMHTLSEYLPPPRTVTALLREGVISDAQAATLFQKTGLSPELAAAYVKSAHHQKTAASKELAKADILAGYLAGLIPEANALGLLEALGWTAHDAQFELALADFRHNKGLLDGAINQIKSLYISRKIAADVARNALTKLGVVPARLNALFAVWTQERDNLVHRLTAADWATAAFYKVVTPEQAITATRALGYTEYEAWVHVSNRLHGPATQTPPAADIPAAYTQGP